MFHQHFLSDCQKETQNGAIFFAFGASCYKIQCGRIAFCTCNLGIVWREFKDMQPLVEITNFEQDSRTIISSIKIKCGTTQVIEITPA